MTLTVRWPHYGGDLNCEACLYLVDVGTAAAVRVLVLLQLCHGVHADVHLCPTAVRLPVVGHVPVARLPVEPLQQEAVAARLLLAHAVRVDHTRRVVKLVPPTHGRYNTHTATSVSSPVCHMACCLATRSVKSSEMDATHVDVWL